jgi:hypothetical protein
LALGATTGASIFGTTGTSIRGGGGGGGGGGSITDGDGGGKMDGGTICAKTRCGANTAIAIIVKKTVRHRFM